jgi:hypothetical protein
MNDPPLRLEQALNNSFSESFPKFPLAGLSLTLLVEKLVLEAAGASRLAPDQRRFAPDQYTLSVNPANLTNINQWDEPLQREVSQALQTGLVAGGLMLAREPHLTLATDPTLPQGNLRIIAWHSSDPLHVTEMMDTDYEELDTDFPPAGAFLMVEGKQHFGLKMAIIRVGRRLDNDLVLDDPHVSREHLHLKAQRGRYLLIDLDSTSGTQVNGRRVKEHWLKPGDIISIATIEMVYGEDRSGPPEEAIPYSPDQISDRDHNTPLNLKAIKDIKTRRFIPDSLH